MNALETNDKTLLVGIGNYGRSDDGLGWEFIDTFCSHDDLFDVEYRYQLQVEDAELISRYNRVIFVDASHSTYEEGFHFYPCTPKVIHSYTSHQLSPESVLWLVHDLFGKNPEGYVMAISGHTWKFKQGLSHQAQENFHKAATHFLAYINNLTPAPSAMAAVL
ncbi:MAG: hydrogenase maturation protease [Cyclobacteriaceae bacterium]|nr:hydrogenase maturation protease [Cyclobacteriaceae bacterium]